MCHQLSLILVVLALSAGLEAQPAGRTQPPPPPTTPAGPPVVLPFPPLMTPPVGGLTPGFPTPPPSSSPPRDLFLVQPGDPVYSSTRSPLLHGFAGGGYPFYGYPIGMPQVPPTSSGPPQMPANGMLRLSVTPLSAQVFVDSYFVGTVADIEARRVLTLPEGPHRIEIRAPEYEPASFDVRLAANDTITYRAALERRRSPAPSPVAPATGPSRIYVIPNCYLGNVPPRADHLPHGCDIKQVHVIS